MDTGWKQHSSENEKSEGLSDDKRRAAVKRAQDIDSSNVDTYVDDQGNVHVHDGKYDRSNVVPDRNSR